MHSAKMPAHTRSCLLSAPLPRPLLPFPLQDYGAGVQTLGLCPRTPNCIATSEELNDRDHFAPPL